MKFGKWNVRRLQRSGSLTAASRELARYKLDLVGVHEVRWETEGAVRAGRYIFLWKMKRKSSIGERIFFVHHGKLSSVNRVIGCRIEF
jgi:hypothetical protein